MLNSIKHVKIATLLQSRPPNKSTHSSLAKLRKVSRISSKTNSVFCSSSTRSFKTNKSAKSSSTQACNKTNPSKSSLNKTTKRAKPVWQAILGASLLTLARLRRRMPMYRSYSLSSKRPISMHSRCRAMTLLSPISKTVASILNNKRTPYSISLKTSNLSPRSKKPEPKLNRTLSYTILIRPSPIMPSYISITRRSSSSSTSTSNKVCRISLRSRRSLLRWALTPNKNSPTTN